MHRFFVRVGQVAHSRVVYRDIKNAGGPEAQQLNEELKVSLSPTIPAIKEAIKHPRDITALGNAIVTFWKAQGKATDTILRHERERNENAARSEETMEAIFGRANLPV